MKNKNKTVWSKRLKSKSSKSFQRIGSSINIDKDSISRIYLLLLYTLKCLLNKNYSFREGKKLLTD